MSKKIEIRTTQDLKDFINTQDDIKKIETALRLTIKVLCIFRAKVKIEDVRAAAIELITEHWEVNNHFEKPLFLIVPKENE